MAPLFRPVALVIYGLFLAVGFVGALILPTLSLFLAKELGVRPLLVGLPFAGIALASMAYNHFIGRWSDGISDRRPLIAACCLVGSLVCAILAGTRYYGLVVCVVVGLLSLALVSFSQLLAYSLDYAEKYIPNDRVPLFNAIVRAQIAIAWVAGPPVGFLLVGFKGFTFMYWVAAALFCIVAALSWRLLPSLVRHSSTVTQPQDAIPLTVFQKRALVLSVIGFSLMWGANNSYLISLPLHLKDGLGIGSEWVGWVMGTCAGLEVPFMLLAGHFAARVRMVYLILFAGFSALVLYAGIYFSEALWQFFVLQIFNAIFIGVLAGLGVSVIQEFMPGRSGSASALYTNTTHMGNLLSSLVVALVADPFGYRYVFLANALLIIVAAFAFAKAFARVKSL